MVTGVTGTLRGELSLLTHEGPVLAGRFRDSLNYLPYGSEFLGETSAVDHPISMLGQYHGFLMTQTRQISLVKQPELHPAGERSVRHLSAAL